MNKLFYVIPAIIMSMWLAALFVTIESKVPT